MSILLAGMLVAVALGASGHRQEEPQEFIKYEFEISNDTDQYFFDTSMELRQAKCTASASLKKHTIMFKL